MNLKAYRVDDETIFAARTPEEAARLYTEWTAMDCEAGYPAEMDDAELDSPQPEFDEDERRTGEWASVRAFLDEATEPGYLAGSMQ